jgi:CTP synthase (UTP-ammonia lyase)
VKDFEADARLCFNAGVQPVRIAVVGDYSGAVTAHRAIDATWPLVSAQLGMKVAAGWLHTSAITPRQSLDGFHGIWCAPASPYANTDGALWAIEWARTRNVPFLGTCGGFQHAVIEIVRHVLGRSDAAHAELEPAARDPLIAPLACALVEKGERITPTGGGRFAQWYGAPREEGFHCSFGLNASAEPLIENAGLEIVARGSSGEVRGVELRGHDFFIGTLFQPERAALRGELHPLVRAFVEASGKRSSA